MMPNLPVWRRILILAGPLILSMAANMLMQFIDGLFLARYSAEAIAATGVSSMAAFCIGSFVTGAVGYTSVLTAHYAGAGQITRIAPAVWQGIWLSLFAGILAAALAIFGAPLFALAGHSPQVQIYETQYFTIVCLGMVGSFLSTAISGFFTGRGKTLTVMNIQFGSIALNAVLAYALIFGKFGFAAHGVAGAAIATVTAQGLAALLFVICFLSPANRAQFHTWQGRQWNTDMMTRLIRFGTPNGFRFFTEIVGWSLFLFFVGRVGTSELAATTIAWRINGVAFFPIVGLSESVRILVGQSQGRNDPDHSAHVTWQGLMLSELWMVGTAALFLLFPREWYAIFLGTAPSATAVADLGVILLRFVAAYCLMDAANIVVCGSLVAAGDTRWTFWANFTGYAIFIASLWIADSYKVGLWVEWYIATVFVMALATVWLFRFFSGRWKHIRVIEPD
jgi:multidrug resistance protein, MATE family